LAIATLAFHRWTAAQGRALIVLSRASNTPLLGWAIGVAIVIASAPHDKYFPPAESRALAARAPHVRLTITTTLQHAVPHVSGDELVGLLRFDGFLVRVLHAAG